MDQFALHSWAGRVWQDRLFGASWSRLLKYPDVTVYHIKTATVLDDFKFPIWDAWIETIWDAWIESARRSTQARTVVLIDEVEKNFKATAWNWLLRYTRDLPNLL